MTVISNVLTCVYLRRNAESACTNGRVKIDNLTRTTDNLQDRAICRWNYAVDYDVGRLPAELVVARCVCPSTAGSSSRCEPVLYWVPVRRWKIGVWSDSWDLVTVGCTITENDDDDLSYTQY